MGFLPRVWEIPSFHEWSIAERVERRWISLTSGRNPRSPIGTRVRTCFFRFNLKTKHVDFIHSFACQCHVYYTKYYNVTCNAVNTHLFKTALNILGEISQNSGKIDIWSFFRSTKTTIYITSAVVEACYIKADLIGWQWMPCKTRSRAAVFMACLT